MIELNDIKKEHIFENEPMSTHTTFRVGGEAKLFVTPDMDELSAILKAAYDKDEPVTIIGNGSNVLVSDKGLDGLVVCIGKPISEINISDEKIEAGAGTRLSVLSNAAKDASLSGLEFAGGIPGSVGGAVMMNAGAYDGEISDVISSIKYFTPDGILHEMKPSDLKLSYRHSVFMEEEYKGCVIATAGFKLKRGDSAAIAKKMKDFAERRKDKQPLEYPSAGSTFKRPEGYFAGRLIEEAGLKGFSVGGACVSEKHSGFIINKGNAKAQDIYTLIQRVSDIVYEKSKVRLESEIRMLGEF